MLNSTYWEHSNAAESGRAAGIPSVFPKKSPNLIDLEDAVGRSRPHSLRGERASTGWETLQMRLTDWPETVRSSRSFLPHSSHLSSLPALLVAGSVRDQTSFLLQARARLANTAPLRTRSDDRHLNPDRLASYSGRGRSRGRKAATVHRAAGGTIINPVGPSGPRKDRSTARSGWPLEISLPAAAAFTEGRRGSKWNRGQHGPIEVIL